MRAPLSFYWEYCPLGNERVEKTKASRYRHHHSGAFIASTEVKKFPYYEKIMEALASCETYLGKLTAAKTTCEEFDNWLWHASAELEYALFLFSLRDSEKNDKLDTCTRKIGSRYRNESRAKLLGKVQNLVIRSKKWTAIGDWHQARGCTCAAGNILLKIQREQERKRPGLAGTRSTPLPGRPSFL